MGKKDLWQSDYFDDKRRFADMMNGALFHGKQVMKAEELGDADAGLHRAGPPRLRGHHHRYG